MRSTPKLRLITRFTAPVLAFLLLLVGAQLPAARGQSANSYTTNDYPNEWADTDFSALDARLHTSTPIIQAGQPVWVECILTNRSDNPIVLPNPSPRSYRNRQPSELNRSDQDTPGIALPWAHIFSSPRQRSTFELEDEFGEIFRGHKDFRSASAATRLVLAPQGSLGRRINLLAYLPILSRPGEYTLTWKPYEGRLSCEPLKLTILAEKQAVLLTDFGTMTIRFYYDQAPRHVANFFELIKQRFYDNLTFHRIVPGGIIQGGDPRGDRTGIRPDQKRLKAEFSDIPFKLGTVGMARTPGDPDSASCQFFLSLARHPQFDRKQTAFGYLVGQESFKTLEKIAALPTDEQERPKRKVYIRAISLENVPSPDYEQAQKAQEMNAPKMLPSEPTIIMGPARELGRDQPTSQPANAKRSAEK